MNREPRNPYKSKEAVKSNTYEIRSELGLTQKEFGNLIGVSDRAIQNYESVTPEYSLPIEKAMFIHKKWGYSLDQIYLDFEQAPIFNNYSVDIRDFISIEGDSVVFSIPDYYWDYINNVKRINESDSLPQEKNRLIKSLEAQYTNKSKSIVWKSKIPISKFVTMIKFGKEEIPYANEDLIKTEFANPTEEQIKEVIDFLNELTKGDQCE